MIPLDLEGLRSIFDDKKTHITVGRIMKLEMAPDRSVLRAQCKVLTQDRDVIAKVAWPSIGPSTGSIQFPEVGDIVLLAFADGDDEQAFVTLKLSNKTDLIPPQAGSGHLVNKALPGKKVYIISDTAILLGKGDSEPTEPMVLGNVMKAFMTEVISRLDEMLDKLIAGPIAISNMPGSLAPTAPGLVADLTVIKNQLAGNLEEYITEAETNIVSQLSFTERGGS